MPCKHAKRRAHWRGQSRTRRGTNRLSLCLFWCARNWVHVIFQEYAPGNGYTAGRAAAAAALTLLIRTGRSVEYKGDSSSAFGNSCRAPHAPPDDQVVIGIHEVPPSQAMEMGQIMPEVETS